MGVLAFIVVLLLGSSYQTSQCQVVTDQQDRVCCS